jgi:tetratricopeptide (TPR) repeat protein
VSGSDPLTAAAVEPGAAPARAASPGAIVARRVAAAWLVALVLGAGAYVTARAAWSRIPHPRPLEELSYYPSGQALRPATLGHAETAADLAWLRAVQYYGAHRLGDNDFSKMSHVFDILTSLAPGFEPAYVFGAFALAQEGGDFPRAEALMLKGLAANPRSGYLAFRLGFLYYVRPGHRELRKAAEMFTRASRQPDAPPQSARFAAFARQHAGDLTVAWELWSEVARSSPNPYLRQMAEREMEKIRTALETGRREAAIKRLSTPIGKLQGS